jgi:beta-lactam-binding protein with PASTA domain
MRGVVVVACVLVARMALAGPGLKVPNLVGKTLDEAKALVKAAGFIAEPEDRPAEGCDDDKLPDYDDGIIQCQSPHAGSVADNKYLNIAVVVRHGGHKKGVLLISQLRPLMFHPLTYVKDALKKLGFDGAIDVKADWTSGGCEPDHVCSIEPMDNVDIHGRITLSTPPR